MTHNSDMRVIMLGPCPACPFRTDEGAVLLRESRKEEIAGALRSGLVFHCHKTVTHFSGGDPILDDARFCGGALVLMEKEEIPNGAKQVAERLGLLDPDELDMEAPVYRSLKEWIDSNSI